MSSVSSLSSSAAYGRQSSYRASLEAQKKRQELEEQQAKNKINNQKDDDKLGVANSPKSMDDTQLSSVGSVDSVNKNNKVNKKLSDADTKLQAKKAKLERLQVRLEQAEQQELRGLKKRDREVKQHELAHASAGGQLSGAPSYQFVTGPDGVRYAISGEVSIKLTTSSDPKKTLKDMQQVQRAALAPTEPSFQDRKVASQAARIALQARAELMKQSTNEEKPKASQSKDELSDKVQKNTDAQGVETEKKKDEAGKKKTDKTNYAERYNERLQEIYAFLQKTLQQDGYKVSSKIRDKA